MMDSILVELFESVIQGRSDQTTALVQKALDQGVAVEEILQEGLVSAMSEVGDRFEKGEFYVPEMLIAARAMQAGMGLLRPYLVESGVEPAGTAVLGTVKGDLHDIGKNLVAMMLEGAGFNVIDLGTDVPPEVFAQTLREQNADIVGMSALLTTTMQSMRQTIEAIEDLGWRDKVKIMVGGAPLTEEFAREIGADGYAPDASRAVTLAKSWV
jgi:5-methyltetrahydrofolate--homocysteine methyltransferase